jgi:hypothetical protein
MGVRHLPYIEQDIEGLGHVMTRGTWNGLPILTWGWAPRQVLATPRQLRAQGLRPGGADAVAVLVFQHRLPARSRDWARLYLIERAVPKTTAGPERVAAALRARRTCTGPCGLEQTYYLSTTSRMCVTCEDTTDFWPTYAAEHGYSWEVAAS